jgi:ABC-type transport system involved in Fe-S cluster assembly fused permease/ATPase subunit
MRSSVRSALENVRSLGAVRWSDTNAFVKIRISVVLILVVAAAIVTALGPVALKQLVDSFSASTIAGIGTYLLVALYVLSQWLSRSAGELRGFIYARVERRVFRALSERVFDHLLRLPMRFHFSRRTGALHQALDNGLQGYQLVMHHLVFTVLPVIAELATTIVVLGRLGLPVFLVLFFCALICYAGAFSYGAAAVVKPAEAASSAAINATGVIVDNLMNVETIKQFAAEDLVRKKVSEALLQSENEWVSFYKRYAYNGLTVATIFALFLAATVGIASYEVQRGRMTVGEFVLVNAYMLQLVRPIEMMGFAMQALSQGLAMLKDMFSLLRETPEVYPSSDCTPIAGIGRLELRGVSASYREGRPVLCDVSFVIERGKTLGVVGASGSGKSTLVRLLTRTLDVDSGSILIDDVPVTKLPLTALRRAIAVVGQDTALLNDSIQTNILIGRPDASTAEVEQAARAARVHEFIESLPEGYDTQVGERGVKLSGGERQRLAIARALLKNPSLFIFDEATSALDSNNERAILQSIIDVSALKTTLIIGHRLSTVVHAHEIVVLDQGTVVERGRHEALLRADGHYAALWRAQHHNVPTEARGGLSDDMIHARIR